jgi:hypothetical protein
MTPQLPLACIALARGKPWVERKKLSTADPVNPVPACLLRQFPDLTKRACILPRSPYRAVENKTDLDLGWEEKKEQKVSTADRTSQDGATQNAFKSRNIDLREWLDARSK